MGGAFTAAGAPGAEPSRAVTDPADWINKENYMSLDSLRVPLQSEMFTPMS